MYKFETESQKGYTLIELLIAVIVVGILAIIAVIFGVNFIKNRTFEQALEEAKFALREAKSQAQKEKKTYTVRFQNKNGKAEYSIFSKGTSPEDWKVVSDEPAVKISEIDVTFDSSGNTKQTGRKLVFTWENKKKCIFIRTSSEEIKKAEGEECN